jgi:hypothetical protein
MAGTAFLRSVGTLIAEVTIKESSTDEMTITQHPVEQGAAITDHVYRNPAMLTVYLGWSASALSQRTTAQSQASNIIGDVGTALDQFSGILSRVVGSGATKALSDALNTASAVASGSSANAIDELYSQASGIAEQYNIPGMSDALSAAYQAIKLSSGSSGGGGSSQAALQAQYQNILDLKDARSPIEVQTGKRLYQNMLIKSVKVETEEETENALLVTIVLQEIILVETLVVTMPSAANRADPAATSGVTNTGTKSTGDVEVVAIGGIPVTQ